MNFPQTKKLTVALGERSYPILIGQKIVPEILRERLQKYVDARRPIAVVTCPSLVRLHAEIFEELRGIAKTIFVTSVDGETAKSTAELVALWENLARERIDRSGVIVAIGGGVVGDLAGFAAGTFLRGIDFIQVPTTLLAMVDSSVGGKTAVNLEAGKNLVGLFYQPQAVLADMNLLATLPQNEFAAGVGEVIKYGMLGDAQLFEQLEAAGTLSAGTPILPAIIQRCCEIKAQVVAADERETAAENGRALLNLGHTFGHAIEKVAGYGAYLHGEAVAIGLVAASKLSEKLGVCGNENGGNELCGNALSARVEKLLKLNNLPTKLRAPLDVPALISAMASDKKVAAGTLKFVLLKSLGNAFTTKAVPAKLVEEIWRELNF